MILGFLGPAQIQWLGEISSHFYCSPAVPICPKVVAHVQCTWFNSLSGIREQRFKHHLLALKYPSLGASGLKSDTLRSPLTGQGLDASLRAELSCRAIHFGDHRRASQKTKTKSEALNSFNCPHHGDGVQLHRPRAREAWQASPSVPAERPTDNAIYSSNSNTKNMTIERRAPKSTRIYACRRKAHKLFS